MDTYENKNMETTEQTASVQPEETGGNVSQEEAVTQTPDYSFHSYSGQGVYSRSQEVDAAPEAEQISVGKEKKGLKRVMAAVLVLALIITSCTVTASIMDASWRKQMQLLSKNFQERIDALQDELQENIGNVSGGVVSPTEGLTPAQLYQQNVKSVVAVSCKTISSEFGQSYISSSSGSGFVLTADGYIVTNHHVISGATEILVITSDETEYKAQLVGSDSFNDIALLKVEATGLQAAVIGSSDALAVGSQVAAIGNALGELTASLTVGYISGKDRDVTTDGTIINMLQTDVAINSGNSGGPLFNMKGEVVGITTAKYSGSTSSGASIEGIGFAIPIDDVIGMLEDLRDYGYITGVRLGVMVSNVDPNAANTYGFPVGVLVSSVESGSCAENAGIRNKDIIIEVGGYTIETMNDLTRVLRKFKAGQEATIKVWRGGQEVLMSIVFDAKNPAV